MQGVVTCLGTQVEARGQLCRMDSAFLSYVGLRRELRLGSRLAQEVSLPDKLGEQPMNLGFSFPVTTKSYF